MRIHIENKLTLALILMAGASLTSMLATLSIDHIVNHDLYNYGLQFSSEWADPYWTMAAVVFSMGWLIILTSLAFEFKMLIHVRRRQPQPEPAPIPEKQAQEEPPKTKAEPTPKPHEQEAKSKEDVEAKTTALAMKTDDGLSEFRVILEEISEMTRPTAARKKPEDKPPDK